MMGAIYRNGFCNIAATGFADGSKGLFASRDPIQLEPVKLTLENDILIGGNHEIERGAYYLVDFDMWRQGVENAPLNRRGWVVQEQCLSVRTLHFGSSQLYWECPLLSACEVLPDGVFHGMRTHAPKSFVHPNASDWRDNVKEWLRPEDVTPKEEDGWTMVGGRTSKKQPPYQRRSSGHNWGMPIGIERWIGIVERLSRSKLTYASDKLIAVAGLAVDMQKHVKCAYLAGLWRADMEHQLLWAVLRPQHGLQLPDTVPLPGRGLPSMGRCISFAGI